MFLPVKKAYVSADSRKKCRLPEKLPFHKMPVQRSERLPFGREKLPFGRVKLPFQFGKRPPAMLNLQKCRFGEKKNKGKKKGAVSMENIVFSYHTGEKCTRREATAIIVNIRMDSCVKERT